MLTPSFGEFINMTHLRKFNVGACMCTYMHIHTCACTYMHMYVHIYAYTYMCMHMHAYTHLVDNLFSKCIHAGRPYYKHCQKWICYRLHWGSSSWGRTKKAALVERRSRHVWHAGRLQQIWREISCSSAVDALLSLCIAVLSVSVCVGERIRKNARRIGWALHDECGLKLLCVCVYHCVCVRESATFTVTVTDYLFGWSKLTTAPPPT
jgi:hypothetical protein